MVDVCPAVICAVFTDGASNYMLESYVLSTTGGLTKADELAFSSSSLGYGFFNTTLDGYMILDLSHDTTYEFRRFQMSTRGTLSFVDSFIFSDPSGFLSYGGTWSYHLGKVYISNYGSSLQVGVFEWGNPTPQYNVNAINALGEIPTGALGYQSLYAPNIDILLLNGTSSSILYTTTDSIGTPSSVGELATWSSGSDLFGQLSGVTYFLGQFSGVGIDALMLASAGGYAIRRASYPVVILDHLILGTDGSVTVANTSTLTYPFSTGGYAHVNQNGLLFSYTSSQYEFIAFDGIGFSSRADRAAPSGYSPTGRVVSLGFANISKAPSKRRTTTPPHQSTPPKLGTPNSPPDGSPLKDSPLTGNPILGDPYSGSPLGVSSLGGSLVELVTFFDRGR